MGRWGNNHTQIMERTRLVYVQNTGIRRKMKFCNRLTDFFNWKEMKGNQQWKSVLSHRTWPTQNFSYSFPHPRFSFHPYGSWGKTKALWNAPSFLCMEKISHDPTFPLLAMEALIVCERKFQLNRLLTTAFSGPIYKSQFAFRSFLKPDAWNSLLSGNREKALWKSYLAIPCGEDEYGIAIQRIPKNELTAIKSGPGIFFTPWKIFWRMEIGLSRTNRRPSFPSESISTRRISILSATLTWFSWKSFHRPVRSSGFQDNRTFPDCPRSVSTRIPDNWLFTALILDEIAGPELSLRVI